MKSPETLPPDLPITRRDAAALLGVSLRSVDNYIAAGALEAHRVAGRRLVRLRLGDVMRLVGSPPSAGGAALALSFASHGAR